MTYHYDILPIKRIEHIKYDSVVESIPSFQMGRKRTGVDDSRRRKELFG